MLNTLKPLAAAPFRRVEAATLDVAIVGATGAVGVESLRCLEARRFPLGRLRLLASPRSAGRLLPRGEALAVEALDEDGFEGIDIALSSAGSAISKRYAAAVRAPWWWTTLPPSAWSRPCLWWCRK